MDPRQRCELIRERLIQAGLFGAVNRWRIAPEPFVLPRADFEFLQSLGEPLLAFYRALNRLYYESMRRTQPAWVAAYLDQGKPDSLVAFSRHKRFRDETPAVIRPDIIPVESDNGPGMTITELDSVPGGIGLTGAMARAYSETASQQSPEIVGGADGMVEGFASMLRGLLEQVPPDQRGCVAIVVSEEARDYRPEMTWLAAQVRQGGLETYCLEPADIRFTENALFVDTDDGQRRVSVVYRFFELFDLPNVPKAELIMYSAQGDRIRVTPPFKPALEEKSAFALLHHPALADFWTAELGRERFELLASIMPQTWILDPRPIPPSAIIPNLTIAGRPVSSWDAVKQAGQKDRRLVAKPSGFSELAWGSRGVSVGHDLSQAEWAAAIDAALTAYERTPYVLQRFHKGRQFQLSYQDEGDRDVRSMAGRARLSPYYFVRGEAVQLGGVLATVVPLDKKVIHGMVDAVMAPCAVAT